jgi:hypothetical protein
MRPKEVVFPRLDPPFAHALEECADYLFDTYEIIAIVACGTVVRGTGDKGSDLDMSVLHGGSFRERVQRFFGGAPFEIFVNPPGKIKQYFSEETAARRPITAHMLGTGFIMYDPQGIAKELAREAHELLLKPPPVDGERAQRDSYFAATLFEDAEDLVERDPAGARLLLGSAVYELVRVRLSQGPAWIPRHKDFFERLIEVDPNAARLATEALETTDLGQRFAAAKELCKLVTGATGFFEWTSSREDAPEPTA